MFQAGLEKSLIYLHALGPRLSSVFFQISEGCDRNMWEFHVALHQPANSAPFLVRSKRATFSRRNETTVESYKRPCLC